MDIKDLKPLTQKEIEAQIISHGKSVLQTLLTPGWQVILVTLLKAKDNIEKERSNGVKNQTNGDRALYYCGKVDGFAEAIDEIEKIVKIAQDIEETRAQKEQMEDE